MTGAAVRAVFFDVDFTLIRPGRAFEGEGYREFCVRHGVDVDPAAFSEAVAAASSLLDANGGRYDPEIFVEYTRRIIEGMEVVDRLWIWLPAISTMNGRPVTISRSTTRCPTSSARCTPTVSPSG